MRVGIDCITGAAGIETTVARKHWTYKVPVKTNQQNGNLSHQNSTGRLQTGEDKNRRSHFARP